MRFFFESAGETDDVLRGRSEGGRARTYPGV